MASSIIKRVAPNLMRVRAMASSSRFYNTRCFQYDKRETEDVCILKCDSKPGSMAHHVVNSAFDARVTPTENLLRLLNYADGINNIKFGIHKVPWWNVEEDDKALYLLRALPTQSEEYPVSDICVTESEESVLHEEYMFAIHPNDEKHREGNMSYLLHAMRQQEMKQINSEPSEYYFHVMHDFKESPRLTIPASGMTRTVSFPFHVSYKLQNPQAIRIILGLGGRDAVGQETDDPFQGYAFEIFLPERLFNVQDAKQHHTGGLWKIRIPKKKGECIQTVGGNLLFFYTKDICKPTLWRPT